MGAITPIAPEKSSAPMKESLWHKQQRLFLQGDAETGKLVRWLHADRRETINLRRRSIRDSSAAVNSI